MRRRGGVCQPVHIVAKEAADGKKSLPEQFFARHKCGSRASRSSSRKPMPHSWSKGLAAAKYLFPVPKRWCFISGFCKHLGKVLARKVFTRCRSQTSLSKPQTLRPMRLCDWGSDVFNMNSSNRWSWKRRAFSAIIYFSAQEHETSSMTNADAVHSKTMEGSCQSNTTFAVENSRVRLKTEGGKPSEGIVETRSAALWGH